MVTDSCENKAEEEGRGRAKYPRLRPQPRTWDVGAGGLARCLGKASRGESDLQLVMPRYGDHIRGVAGSKTPSQIPESAKTHLLPPSRLNYQKHPFAPNILSILPENDMGSLPVPLLQQHEWTGIGGTFS